MMVVYKILNKINGHFYIGSTVNYLQRKSYHKSSLNKKNSSCRILQNAWTKYGENNFEFIVLEEVDCLENLIEREQYYLDTLFPIYNIRKIAELNTGLNTRTIIQYDKTGNFIKEWSSIKLAAKTLNINAGNISHCCLGNSRTYKGFIFKYKSNYIPYKEPTYTREDRVANVVNMNSRTYLVTNFEKSFLVTNLKQYCSTVGWEYTKIMDKLRRGKATYNAFTIERT